MDENLAILRTKKISLFMRQAREKSAQTVDNCAFWLNINREEYLTMESGTVSPSLPQLESLAYFLNSSFGFLLNGPDKEEEIKSSFSQDVNINFLNLRNHVITVLLKQHRPGEKYYFGTIFSNDLNSGRCFGSLRGWNLSSSRGGPRKPDRCTRCPTG